MTPLTLGLRDTCQKLGISLRTGHRLLRAGAFPLPEVVGLSAHHRFSVEAVEQFVASHGRVRFDVRPRHVRHVSQLRVVASTPNANQG